MLEDNEEGREETPVDAGPASDRSVMLIAAGAFPLPTHDPAVDPAPRRGD